MADTKPGATHASTEHPAGGHNAGFPPFDFSTFPSQILWFAIAFGLLYRLMAGTALPRVGATLENRQSRISGDLDAAAAMQKQADEAGKAYEKTLADAKARAQALAQEASAKASAAAEANRKQVEADLNAKLATAESRIVETKAAAMANVDEIARETAAAIVQHLTGKSAAADAIARAVGAARGA